MRNSGKNGADNGKRRRLTDDIEADKTRERSLYFFVNMRDVFREKGLAIFKRGLGGVIDEYREYKKKKGELIEKYEAYEIVAAGATDTPEYYILLVLSCLIATLGLYQNSAAVIIGAMILAPLMGPVFGFSAGIQWGSWRLLLKSITTLAKGLAVVVLVTAALSFLLPGVVVTAEMAARAKPTFFDVAVALCCGLVGAYAFLNKRISSAIPGVAISVALMPPLCTVGIGIGLRRWDLAAGAGLLFAVNIVGISLAALVVFYLVRLHPRCDEKEESVRAKKRAFGQIVISTVFLALISIPLVYFSSSAFRASVEKDAVFAVFSERMPEDKIYSWEITPGDPKRVSVVLLHRSDAKPDRGAVEAELSRKLQRPVKLDLFFIDRAEDGTARTGGL